MPLPTKSELDKALWVAAQASKVKGWAEKLLLQRRKGAAVNGLGFDFFPHRESLIKKYGTLGRRFENASSVSALWVIGQRFYHSDENTDKIKKLLLPDPDGEAFKALIDTGPNVSAGEQLKEITALAKNKGAKVKWYDHFIHHSLIIADIDKPTAWVHVESVFPHSKTEQRPSWTITKERFEKLVLDMQRIFEDIWDGAKQQ
jgi:hypothetical protein